MSKSAELPTIRVEPELLERCRRKSERTGVKLAFVVRQALEAWADEDEGALAPTAAGAPAETRGLPIVLKAGAQAPADSEDSEDSEDVPDLAIVLDEDQPLEVEGEEGRTHARRRAK